MASNINSLHIAFAILFTTLVLASGGNGFTNNIVKDDCIVLGRCRSIRWCSWNCASYGRSNSLCEDGQCLCCA
ncbi:transmembrane protein, putative [Medicago truncatula]|uniref:Transmembrane protein, putative n=1 Tax=Medicago truncatula TaxID=3880 RepID=G7KFM8_MEDTR|nr:transmembrane protein, putative [Medicago truncatula]